MSTSRLRRNLTLVGATASALALGAGLGAAVYAQIASQGKWPLYYSGAIEEKGAAPTGDRAMKLELWSAQEGGTTPLCTVSKTIPVKNGRFQLPVSDCATELRNAPEAWVAVSFVDEGGTPHEMNGRARIGAVPYALEAERAGEATGALEGRLQSMESASPSRVAFLAQDTNGDSLANQAGPTLVFENAVFNYGGEYNPSDGKLTSKSGGLYEVGCNVIFFGTAGKNVYLEAGIFVNDKRVDVDAGLADPYVASFRARSLLKLSANDVVTCRAYQNSGSTMSLIPPRPGEAVSSFSAVRLAPVI